MGRKFVFVLIVLAAVIFGFSYFIDPHTIYYLLEPRTRESPERLSFVCNLFTPASRSVGLYGGDLGASFVHDGRVFLALGDVSGLLGRSNALFSDNRHSNAIGFSGVEGFNCSSINWLDDGSGRFLELVKSKRVFGDASTVPTGGISLNNSIYLFMMRVTDWFRKPPETSSVLLKSLDGGKSFNEVFSGDPDSKFANVAPVLFEDYVYLFWTGRFRDSLIYLAKVKPGLIESPEEYLFFDGVSWGGDVNNAVPLVEGEVGELSVQLLGDELFMMYADYSDNEILLRKASRPEGPWNDSVKVMSIFSVFGWGESVFGDYYAPYIVPGVSNQSEVYFTVSLWWPYTVNLLKLDLGNETVKT